MKILAHIVSYIFHPLLFPTYATLLILFANPHLFGPFGDRTQMVWLIIVFALTFMFPVIWIAMMRGLQMIQNFKFEDSKDRMIPFIATATFYLWAAWMFKPQPNMKIPPNLLIFYMMTGACFAIFIAFFVNIFSKISLHTIGAGSLFGLLLILIRYSSYDLRLIFVAAILAGGFIGTARLVLGSHNTREVTLGYLAGFTSQFVAFIIVPHFF